VVCRIEKDGVVVEETLKMKGIRQNVKAMEKLTPETFNGLVEAEKDLLYGSGTDGSDSDEEARPRPEIRVKQFTIRRNFAKRELRSNKLSKRIRMLSNKRYFPSRECFVKLFPDEPDNSMLRTFPWGYCFDE